MGVVDDHGDLGRRLAPQGLDQFVEVGGLGRHRGDGADGFGQAGEQGVGLAISFGQRQPGIGTVRVELILDHALGEQRRLAESGTGLDHGETAVESLPEHTQQASPVDDAITQFGTVVAKRRFVRCSHRSCSTVRPQKLPPELGPWALTAVSNMSTFPPRSRRTHIMYRAR